MFTYLKIAPLSERNKVQEINVIYRGSTSPDKITELPGDVYKDWFINNLSMGSNILGKSQGNPPPQLKSSAETLKNAMALYPNANVYGHSLASMNGQHAVSDLTKEDLSRIYGGFFYQGPNIYSTLTPQQQSTAETLTALNKLFNYVDPKDLVPIGYGKGKKMCDI